MATRGRPVLWSLVASVVLGVGAAQPSSPQATADAEALRAESLMVEAMGGRDAWESARFFDFVWAIDRGQGEPFQRRHVWDRWTGRYKLEMPWEETKELVVLFNTNTKQGDAWIDGVRMTGDTVQALVNRAYSAYINDTYWFLMPFKWRDPGVHLSYKGSVRDSTGKAWEAVQLTFDDVGLTPQNRYMAYLDPQTHRMGWWEHFRNRSDSDASTRSLWAAWERRGPIMVSLDRPFLNRPGARIFFPRAIISTRVDESAFQPPAG